MLGHLQARHLSLGICAALEHGCCKVAPAGQDHHPRTLHTCYIWTCRLIAQRCTNIVSAAQAAPVQLATLESQLHKECGSSMQQTLSQEALRTASVWAKVAQLCWTRLQCCQVNNAASTSSTTLSPLHTYSAQRFMRQSYCMTTPRSERCCSGVLLPLQRCSTDS